MDELVEIVDSNGRATGKIETRSNVHLRGMWHPVAHVWIYNDAQEILLQKRSARRISRPGLLDVLGEHMMVNERPGQAAIRALAEEMGISAEPAELHPLLVIRTQESSRGIVDNQFVHAFAYRFNGDISTLNLQTDEVESLIYVPLRRFRFELTRPVYASRYSPRTRYFLRAAKALERKIAPEHFRDRICYFP